MLVTAIAFAAWWTLVALGGMLRWRRAAAAGACLGAAGQARVAQRYDPEARRLARAWTRAAVTIHHRQELPR